eukprot:c19985_g1_i1.p1 GENE.c19985_g1_i1~~c19985_g1_i1.p1  ORF type:complete len:310 (-),score=45.57 c19985_g1_i1:35-943(-)
MSNSTLPRPPVGLHEIASTLTINSFAGIGLLLLFEFLRNWKPVLFALRTSKLSEYAHRCPPMPSTKILSWAWAARRVRDSELLERIGPDAFVIIRTIRVCYRICLFGTLVGLLITTPIFVTGQANLDVGTPAQRDPINMYSIQHLSPEKDESRLWAVVFLAYVILSHALYVIRDECTKIVMLRRRFVIQGAEDVLVQSRYSVMVENIPPEFRSNAALKAYFEAIFPDQVHSAIVLRDVRELNALVVKRNAASLLLEKALLKYNLTGDRPRVVRWSKCSRRKIDAIEEHTATVNRLNILVQSA